MSGESMGVLQIAFVSLMRRLSSFLTLGIKKGEK